MTAFFPMNQTALLYQLNSHRESGKYLQSTSVISRPYNEMYSVHSQ